MRRIPDFEYTGRTEQGTEVKGKIEAPSKAAASVRLRQKGIWIEALEESGAARRNAATPRRWWFAYGLAPVKPGSMGHFFDQLAGLYRAGVSLGEAVDGMTARVSSGKLARVLRDTRPIVQRGGTLAEGLEAFPQVFPPGVVGMVRVGEITGNLDEAALDLAADYHAEQRIWWLLLIPKIYFLIVLVLAALIPSFPMVLQAPDIVSGLRLWVAHVIAKVLPWMLVAVAGYLVLRIVWNLPGVLRVRDIPAYYLPVWRALTVRYGLCRFFRALELSVRAGVDFPTALESAADAAGNRFMVRQIRAAGEAARRGTPLDQALMLCPFISRELLGSLSSAAQGGTFDQTLPRLTEQMKTARDQMMGGLRLAALVLIYATTVLIALGALIAGYLLLYKSIFERAGVGDILE